MKDDLSLWAFGHAIIMLMSVIVGMAYDALFVLLWTVSISLAGLITMTSPEWRKLKPVGGYANMMTLARFILLIITLSMHRTMDPWLFAGLILLVVIADGIDGYLARRFNHVTEAGAVFDMEVDAFLALALSIIIWELLPEAFWVLFAGFLRYVFVIFYRVVGWHRREHGGVKGAKVMAVIFFSSLLTPFIFGWSISKYLTIIGAVVVAFSFAREFYLISKSE